MKKIKTTCPYCGVGCGIIAEKQSNSKVVIKGDEDHPANFGRLCSKGSQLAETLGMEDRLLYPEIFGKRASWNQAMGLVAEKFSEAIKEHGPDSVAFYLSGQILTEDYYVANKLMKGYIGSANIDTNSRLCMASSVTGHRRAFGTDTVPGIYEDLEEADLVILVGSNLAWCHPVLYQRLLAAKEMHPHMKVILIDPRNTMTAQGADVHLPLKADGDVALFSGLLKHLSKSDALNRDYITQHTNGFDEALKETGALTLKTIEKETGLKQEDIISFYDAFSKTEKVVTLYSQGVNQSASGSDKVNAILNCHLATGRIGKKGMGPFSITGQPNAMGGREVGGLATMLAAHMDIENDAHRELVQRFWKSPKMADKQGLKAVDLFDAVDNGKIKALWIMATSPVDSMPNADKVASALEKCPFVVVSDVTHNTDTIAYAHIKLPSLAWGEKDGTVTNSERRISRQRAFLKTPGEARPDWWQLAELGRLMGYEQAFCYKNIADIFKEHAALSAYENDGARDFNIGAYQKITKEDYQALKPFQWPQAQGKDTLETRFFEKGNFYTPDRKANFIKTKVGGLEKADSHYPFTLNTGRIRDQWHTMTRTGKSARLSSHMAEPYVEIHPENAMAQALREGDLALVESTYGSVIVRVTLTHKVQKNSLFIPMHWTKQFSSKGRVNALMSQKNDPFSGQPALKMGSAKLSKFNMQGYGFCLSRKSPRKFDMSYWAKALFDDGYRLEFAFEKAPDNLEAYANTLLEIEKDWSVVVLQDRAIEMCRMAWFSGRKLMALFFYSKQPVSVSRQLMVDAFKSDYAPEEHHQILSGMACADRPDKGALVCSCFNVGVNEIKVEAQKGVSCVAGIGKALKAGTNCGSCRSEIGALLEQVEIEAAEYSVTLLK